MPNAWHWPMLWVLACRGDVVAEKPWRAKGAKRLPRVRACSSWRRNQAISSTWSWPPPMRTRSVSQLMRFSLFSRNASAFAMASSMRRSPIGLRNRAMSLPGLRVEDRGARAVVAVHCTKVPCHTVAWYQEAVAQHVPQKIHRHAGPRADTAWPPRRDQACPLALCPAIVSKR